LCQAIIQDAPVSFPEPKIRRSDLRAARLRRALVWCAVVVALAVVIFALMGGAERNLIREPLTFELSYGFVAESIAP